MPAYCAVSMICREVLFMVGGVCVATPCMLSTVDHSLCEFALANIVPWQRYECYPWNPNFL